MDNAQYFRNFLNLVYQYGFDAGITFYKFSKPLGHAAIGAECGRIQ